MKKVFILLGLLAAVASTLTVSAQGINRPAPALVEQAKAIVVDNVFARLETGEADSLAAWVTDQTHTDASGTPRLQQLSQFQSQFRMITQEGPNNPFGKLDGYDLLQEAFLPGSDRYFRLLYITYHKEAALVWEVHFYVGPERDLHVSHFQFSGSNPFSYMTTPDMLIERYYSPY